MWENPLQRFFDIFSTVFLFNFLLVRMIEVGGDMIVFIRGSVLISLGNVCVDIFSIIT